MLAPEASAAGICRGEKSEASIFPKAIFFFFPLFYLRSIFQGCLLLRELEKKEWPTLKL
ncbi:MAG: hypothetical protein Q8P67_25780 [archaeon]|nr:hypothetical protein [archaeon]